MVLSVSSVMAVRKDRCEIAIRGQEVGELLRGYTVSDHRGEWAQSPNDPKNSTNQSREKLTGYTISKC